MEHITEMLPELQRPHVYIKNREKVDKILEEIIQEGADKLQVIADFDRTLTRYMYNGEQLDTCHRALDDSSYLPSWYREKATALRDTYLPIEYDPNIPMEEKCAHMIKWWTSAHDLLMQCDITREKISDTVRNSSIRLREGCDWLFSELNKAEVPLLIFSAGIGNVIEEAIKQQSTMYSNMKVVSNYMDFNDQGALVGFKGELIHTFNKNENAIHKSDYFNKLKDRDNIILLGDSLGDLRMAEGAQHAKHILKIGFLNYKVESLLPKYTEIYDIVLASDETMDIPNAIAHRILS